jgi:hypothetical protein
MEKTTITFDELIDLFYDAYAVDVVDNSLEFVNLDEGVLCLGGETFVINQEDNETVTVSPGPTYTVNLRSEDGEEPNAYEIRFLKLI